MKRFGEKIRTLRQQHGLTQLEMSNALNIDRTHLSDLERGKKLPHGIMILKFVEFFDVTPNDLMLDDIDLFSQGEHYE